MYNTGVERDEKVGGGDEVRKHENIREGRGRVFDGPESPEGTSALMPSFSFLFFVSLLFFIYLFPLAWLPSQQTNRDPSCFLPPQETLLSPALPRSLTIRSLLLEPTRFKIWLGLGNFEGRGPGGEREREREKLA
ncbi:hypothetical protein IE53DRAFT_7334 [Violaceomyces palustris]|uniref:Uncharacterized protein n=1 Tax=Violaceomyces palustris TaxID=1673888 RepID=A0ACD0P2D9_9BASI|nr:hypothetical protein IE53DRAFT_7334 [Violaceomyces palustris]